MMKKISIFIKKKLITKNKYNNKNTKTNDDVTHERKDDDNINNVYVGSMSRELFIII